MLIKIFFFLNEEVKHVPWNLCFKEMLLYEIFRRTETMVGQDKIAFHSLNSYPNSYNNFYYLLSIYHMSGLNIVLFHLNSHSHSLVALSFF